MGEGTRTLYQHDARRQPDGTITLFNNGGMFVSEESRVVEIRPNEEDMTATLAREYTHPNGVLAPTQGNAQRLPNGNLFVGWGSEPVFSEFAEDGDLLYSARLPAQVESTGPSAPPGPAAPTPSRPSQPPPPPTAA